MNCPKCNKEADVYVTSTCVGYAYVKPFPNCDHDNNSKGYTIKCACGFQVSWTQDNKCPACEWVGKKGTFRDTPTKEELLKHGNL